MIMVVTFEVCDVPAIESLGGEKIQRRTVLYPCSWTYGGGGKYGQVI